MERGTSYFGVRDPRHARRDLDRFRERGLDAVLHPFSERDRRYYQGTMAELVSASHDRDMRVYVNPWGVGRAFGGEALSAFIGRWPEACQVLSTDDRVPAACFNAPEFREYVRAWTRDAVDIGADVVFWDEPHWFIPRWHAETVPASAWSCRCQACQDRFEAERDRPMPTDASEAVGQFRADSLLAFLREMMALVRELGAENAVCPLPVDGPDHGLRDLDRLAAIDTLDVLATDPYWAAFDEPLAAFVGTNTERVVRLADLHGLDSQVWIQGFGLDGDPSTVEQVRQATEIAVDGGADSVFMWGWDGCRVLSSIASETPEAVWEAFLGALPDG